MEDRIKTLKDKFLNLVEEQLSGDLSHVDAEELGEVVDMAKDMAELSKYCEEAKYYEKITKSMDRNSDSENKKYIEKYLPESRRYYSPIWDKMDYPIWEDKYYKKHKPPYYTDEDEEEYEEYERDEKEGRSGITRRTYMDMKDDKTVSSQMKLKELERYIHDLADDINEMIEGLDSNEKATVKNKLSQLATKII